MKKVTTSLTLLGVLTLGISEDATIDEQIERIQNAPQKERVVLMNQLKLKLSMMNKEQRIKSMVEMQAKMKGATMTKTQLQERMKDPQMKVNDKINRYEHQYQGQAGSQAARDNIPRVRIPTH